VHAYHLHLAAFAGGERVLEIGTGSGFQTALLATLAREVFSIETVPELAAGAGERLAALGVENVKLHVGDGSQGWPEHAPYDVILVGAAAPQVPSSLPGQLAPDGRLLIPVGGEREQRLVRITRTEDGFAEETLEEARFVPLVGEEGW
jgi:protein-L-isoaspartate(D-aspartate) O-methyltransferase